MFFVCSKTLVAIFSLGNADGVVVYPFIFLKSEKLKKSKTFINHEKIHFSQIKEMLVLPFYIVYFIELLLKTIKYGDFTTGYRAISFEREAYANEHNLNYLQERTRYSFLKYLIKKD